MRQMVSLLAAIVAARPGLGNCAAQQARFMLFANTNRLTAEKQRTSAGVNE
jgi:hypothetical protein